LTLLFWLLASLLILIALVLVLPPLWRQRTVAVADMDGRNIAIAKHRLAELKEQLQAGALTPAQYEEQRTELELALSDDLDIVSATQAVPAQGRWLVYVLVLAVPMLAASLYAGLGTYQAIEPTPEMLGSEQDVPDMDEMGKMVEKLAERMKTNPDDAEGWIMLGKSYKYMQQFPKAVDAFAQAYRLLGDKPDIMLMYAEALAYGNDQELAGKPAELVFKALAIEPENVAALWFGGMAKAQAGDNPAAAKLWQKLAGLLPPGSKELEEVQGLLAKVGSPQESEPSEATEADAMQPAHPADVAIAVQVSLAPELQNPCRPAIPCLFMPKPCPGQKCRWRLSASK